MNRLILLALLTIPCFGQGAVFAKWPIPDSTGTRIIAHNYALGLGRPTQEAQQFSTIGYFGYYAGQFEMRAWDGSFRFVGTQDASPVTFEAGLCDPVTSTITGTYRYLAPNKLGGVPKRHVITVTASFSQPQCGDPANTWMGGGNLTIPLEGAQ
jgi:hypothetical protein